MAEKWIAGAIKKKGSLRSAAAAAGKSITEYCAQKNLSPLARKRCSLAKTLRSFKK